MSGQLSSRVGAYDNAAEFPAQVPTFAHYLVDQGYHTCLSGKMHFVGPDQLHGFQERVTTDIYPSDFGWTPDWLAEGHRKRRPSGGPSPRGQASLRRTLGSHPSGELKRSRQTHRLGRSAYLILAGGEGGIRTLGTLRYTAFPMQRDRPLCHLSFVTS